MPDNLLTSAEIKRRGLAAIEERLQRGPVHLMKRKKPAAVVLSEEEYLRLLAAQNSAPPGLGALQWLMTQSPTGQRSREEIDTALAAARRW